MLTSITPSILSRRELLQQATALIAGAAAGAGRLQAQQPGDKTARFFPGFKPPARRASLARGVALCSAAVGLPLHRRGDRFARLRR